jgi:hypothetical protein
MEMGNGISKSVDMTVREHRTDRRTVWRAVKAIRKTR